MTPETQNLIGAIFGLFLLISFFIFFIAGFFRSPFVPSNRPTIQKMLAVAKIKPGEKVFDLGCGDGRLLVRAEKVFAAKAVGYEISIFVWSLAQLNRLWWQSKAKIYRQSFWQIDLKKADIVFCYLLPAAMEKLSPKFKKELQPGARIISAAFHLPDFKPTQTFKKTGKVSTIFVYKIK